MAAFSFLLPQSRAMKAFIQRLSRSRFLTISVALHFLFVLTFGSVVLVRQAAQKVDMETGASDLVAQEAAAPPADPVQPLQQPTDPTQPTQPSNAAPVTSLSAITSLSDSASAFTLPANPSIEIPTAGRQITAEATSTAVTNAAPKFSGIPAKQAGDMARFTQSWRQPGDSGSGVGKDRRFKFTAFLARYAGGDWDSTVQVRDGQISKGSLPNMLFLMKKWSSDRIDADPNPVPLDIASDDLFTKKPPFVLFTGHRDFKLTDKEIENLQKYLQLGGCVWGDSSLPGNRSRFDLAFRREMKRVLPDQDINWETLPPDHDLYVKKYYPEVKGVPGGMNYYQEPVYALKNFGEVVVIYTANDYCDMWQIGLDEKGQYDLRKDQSFNYVATNIVMYEKRSIYFRNLELPALSESYKFGTNVVVHLLTRWEDKLRNVPLGL